MASSFLIPPGGGELISPSSVDRRRRLAQALLESNTSGPVSHWTQGAARLAKALMGGVHMRAADEAEERGRRSASDTVGRLTSAMIGAPTSTPSFSVASSEAGTSSGSNPSYRDAIASIESRGSGDYGAVGPTHPKMGRALGRYQVMESNIGPWSQEALGRSVTPDEFLASPQIQDKVFDHRFGQYVNQFGSPDKAAQAWFAGPGGVGTDRKDSLGTSVPEYTRRFNAALGDGDQAQMPQAAQPAQGSVPPGAMPQSPSGRLQQLIAAAQNPWLDPGQRSLVNTLLQQEMKNSSPELSAHDLGDRIGFTDRQGNLVREIPKSPAAKTPTYGVIGKDQYGVEQYGWIDPSQRMVTPGVAPSPGAPPAAGVSTSGPALPAPASEASAPVSSTAPPPVGDNSAAPAAPVTIPPAPPGVNPRVWRDEQTKKAVDAAGAPKLTEQQSKDVVYLKRGVEALANLNQFDEELTSGWQSFADGLPFGNYLTGDKFQQANQAGREFLASVLRKDTGAAVTPAEMDVYGKIYLPQPGDAPDVIRQKAVARQRALDAIHSGLGTAQTLFPGYAAVADPEPAKDDGGSPPEGVDAQAWKFMTPEERALWK